MDKDVILMRKIRTWIIAFSLIMLSLFFASCAMDRSAGPAMMDEMDMASEEAIQDTADYGEVVRNSVDEGVSELDLGEKIIETVNVTYETVDFDASLAFVEEQIAAHNGALENSSRWQNSSNYSSRADRISMMIRIPNDQLRSFMDTLSDFRGLVVQYEDLQRTDVTRVYRDNETRIEILQEEETVLREMLQEQGSLEEILQIRTRLSEIVTQREIFENENRDYDNMIDYSTVYLEIIQTNRANTTDGVGFWNRITDAIGDAFYSFIAVVQNLFISFIYLIPYLVILGILAFVVYRIVRSRKKL